MDWSICLLCQFPRSNGKQYTALGRSGWICDECIRLEICQSCRSKRWKVVIFSLLVLIGMSFSIYYSAAQVRGSQPFPDYLLKGQYLDNFLLKILGWFSGVPFITWENLLLFSMIPFLLAVMLLFFAALQKPSFSKKNYDVQGKRVLSHLIFQNRL